MSANRVRDNGFENQTLGMPVGAPWQSINTTTIVSGGAQLEGNFAASLSQGAAITQQLRRLIPGRSYTFTAAFSTGAGSGTIDVSIGSVTRNYQGNSVVGAFQEYATYVFRFNAPAATPSLTITNNTNTTVKVDTIFVLLQEDK
ncbi:hypothetical protein SAMN05444487_11215 [Marininema mesophilum]|uniref:Carbohydrate binding domain-containing protein n=1 Tax=Marininema mesophilum TaxID=1048340 RepID=A0A1H2ZUJ1_9BACL|nr:hypothetical protein [Marininema mesophilum]SDX21240.1 hypothetical protein SAMN05444487_11215 [Marininema mesophilum]